MKKYTFESSNAFVEVFDIQPSQSGPLSGLNFAVKDNIDIAGFKTSYGSKPWRDSHPAAVYHALCIEQLLAAGAVCTGKTVADELTYSLDGESYFYGTPVNPKAPEHIPGGSSSGSASAVACGLVDFAIGTDSAGSVRVPASLCGVWGMRPSLHRISEAGVLPFMPSVSTVGAMSGQSDILNKVMRVLLRSQQGPVQKINHIYLLQDAFDMADAAVLAALDETIEYLKNIPNINISCISLKEIMGEEISLNHFNERALRELQTAEFANTTGSWVQQFNPETGPGFKAGFANVLLSERSKISDALFLCEKIFQRLLKFTAAGDLFCFPSVPVAAPKKGSLNHLEAVLDFYGRTMAVTSFAGVARLPEITIPVSHIAGVPVGLSLVAGYYQDEFLLDAAKELFARV
ncbi:MAG: amidase family protein [Iodobacter sp.]